MICLNHELRRLTTADRDFIAGFSNDLLLGERSGIELITVICDHAHRNGPPVVHRFLERQLRQERRHERIAARLLRATGSQARPSPLTPVLQSARGLVPGEIGVAAIHLMLERLILVELSALVAAFSDCPQLIGTIDAIRADEAAHAGFGLAQARRSPAHLAAWDAQLETWTAALLPALDLQSSWDGLSPGRQERYLVSRAATWARARSAVLSALMTNGLDGTARTLAGWRT